MKLFISSVLLFTSLSSFAYEVMVFDGPRTEFSNGVGKMFSGLYVDQETGKVGVQLTYKKRIDDFSERHHKFFPINDMYLDADKVMINVNGELIECGTMSETRILRNPALIHSGLCTTRIETINVGSYFNPKILVKAFLSVQTSN